MTLRNYVVVAVATFLLLSCGTKDQKIVVDAHEISDQNPIIVLMHPTVRNLKTFLYLTQNDIFALPSQYHVVGFYHASGSYDYRMAQNFILEEGLTKFKLVEAKPELSVEKLYERNDLSETFRALLKKSNGIIFFGGPDLPPATYGKPTGLLTEITDIHRHYLELSFLFHLLGGSQDTLFTPLLELKPNYAVLGICLGMQTMNVATGGTMIQDIPTEIFGLNTVEEVLDLEYNQQHRNYNTNFGVGKDLIWGTFHQIRYEERSLFHSLNGFSSAFPHIWSSHHQCIDSLGENIVPVAWSMDGKIIEAIVHGKYPNVIGVQFHPEVQAIFDPENKIKREPSSEETFLDLFPGEKGEDFNRNFWKYISGLVGVE